MSKFTRIQNSFLSGEISPKLYGRTETDSYSQGLKTLKNFISLPQGGVTKRPGTISRNEDTQEQAITWDENSRLIPFIYNKDEAYIIVLSTGANFAACFQIYKVDTATFDNPLAESVLTDEFLASPYIGFSAWSTLAELNALDYSQSGDVLVITDPDQPPIIVARTGSGTFDVTNWYNAVPYFTATVQPYTGSNTGIQEKITSATPLAQAYAGFPYRDLTLVNTYTASATSGTVVLTSSGGTWGLVTRNGTILRITVSGVTGYAIVVDDTYDVDQVQVNTLKDLGATTAFDSIEIVEWVNPDQYDYSYPKKVVFDDQRILFAGIDANELKVWGSQVGDITEMMLIRSADDSAFGDLSNDRPFAFTIHSNQINKVNWMLPALRKLFAGSAGNELNISGPDRALTIGPLNIGVRHESSYGSEEVKPINIEGGFIFVERGGYKLREFVYNRDEDAFRANDISVSSEHLSRHSNSIFATTTDTGFNRLSYQKTPYQLIWSKDANGYLLGLTRERLLGVNAWHRHELGGESAADEPPIVLDHVVLPNTSGRDDLYLLVKRVVNGATNISLESMSREFEGTSLNVTSSLADDYPVYVDAARVITPESSVTFMNAFNTTLNADVFDGSQIAANVGSAAITDGLLDLSGATLKYLTFDATDNADAEQIGSIRFRVTPGYTGSPATDQHFVTIAKAESDSDNLIEIVHTSSGALRYAIKDSGGSTVASATAAWSPTSGTEYELLLRYDLVNRNDLYLDGVSHANDTGTGTRSSDINFLAIGTDVAVTKTADFKISYVAIYSTDVVTIPVQVRIYEKFIQTQGSMYYGQEIQAVSSGKFMGTMVNTYGHGVLSFDPSTTNVLVGLKYESILETLDVEAGSILGSAQGQVKRLEEITLRFHKTVGAKYGYDTDNLDEINFLNYQYGDDEPINLFTGDKTVKFPHGYEDNYYAVVQHDVPFPCYLSCIVMRGLTYD